MDCFELTPVPAKDQDLRGFIGGTPPLPADSVWPTCRMCGDDLVHYLDVQLPEGSSPFTAGSRLQVFACREHDDIAGTIYSNYERFASVARSKRLRDKYWDITDGHYLLRLLPPDVPLKDAGGPGSLAERSARGDAQMDATRLHRWVDAYNWDDGLAPMWPIADSPRTEFATALLIYWRLGGPWLEGDTAPVNAEAVRLQALVRERLLAGFYAQGAVHFDPSVELSHVQLYQLRKDGVPELLLGQGGQAELGRSASALR